ncbi:MAG: MFS transporter [Planctomycetales bacterium]|nr:MFS transporter [Planctomycetales bacterium]
MHTPNAGKKCELVLDRRGRVVVLVASFLGWMFAGWEMALLPLSARAATIGLLPQVDAFEIDQLVAQWFARYIAAFLFGAALGGLVFGWYGDHAGRTRAMGISVLWYSIFTGLTYAVESPLQLVVLRFVACMGIGGMWPAGVSLVSEAWPNVARPTLAGLIGTAANVGMALLGIAVRLIGELSPAHFNSLRSLGDGSCCSAERQFSWDLRFCSLFLNLLGGSPRGRTNRKC